MSPRAGTLRVRVGMVVDLDMVNINSSQLLLLGRRQRSAVSCEQSGEECKQFGSAGARWTGVLRLPACAYAVPISFEMGKRKEREE